MRLQPALLSIIVAIASFAAAQDPAPAPPDARAIIRRAAQNQAANEKKARAYTYVERVEQRKLDDHGAVISVDTTTSEIMVLYGEQVKRLLERNDKPLSDKERQKEEDRISTLSRARQNESEKERQQRLAKEEKQRADGMAFVEEIAGAYDFRFLPPEAVDARPTWVIAAEPRRDYKPQRKEARILPKFRFTVWVDQADYAWTKLDAIAIDTISFGWFLARIHPGTRIRIEQTRVNDEVWLPRHVAATLDARVALFRNYNMELDAAYRDYRKFRVDSKMIAAPGTPQR